MRTLNGFEVATIHYVSVLGVQEVGVMLRREARETLIHFSPEQAREHAAELMRLAEECERG